VSGPAAAPGDLPPLFDVVDTGTTIDVDGRAWPTAVIDAVGHPAVADLARVHAVEGIGDVETRASLVVDRGAQLLLLGVRLTVPVRCAFALAFRLPEHRAVLDDAGSTGRLTIATSPPDATADDRTVWLAIDLDGERLAAVLPAG
jgi:hypothetical protein